MPAAEKKTTRQANQEPHIAPAPKPNIPTTISIELEPDLETRFMATFPPDFPVEEAIHRAIREHTANWEFEHAKKVESEQANLRLEALREAKRREFGL